MNKFNVGDRVQYIQSQHLIFCYVTGAIFDLRNKYGTVLAYTDTTIGRYYEVKFDIFPTQVENCIEGHLQVAPINNNLSASNHWKGLIQADPKFSIPPVMYAWFGTISTDNLFGAYPGLAPKCTCGGFKTFNTMDEHAHSSWCDSRSKVSNG